jgi:hypothetical protein
MEDQVFNYVKKKNIEDFVINSYQDNETFKAPVTLTFELVTQNQKGSSNCYDQSVLEILDNKL